MLFLSLNPLHQYKYRDQNDFLPWKEIWFVYPTRRNLKALRWSLYVVLLLMIYFLGDYSSEYEFIYFQF